MPCTIEHYFICMVHFFPCVHSYKALVYSSVLPAIQRGRKRREKGDANKIQTNLIVDSSFFVAFRYIGFIRIVLGHGKCSNQHNNKQISQYNFNKVDASIFKSQCSINPLKCVRYNCFDQKWMHWFWAVAHIFVPIEIFRMKKLKRIAVHCCFVCNPLKFIMCECGGNNNNFASFLIVHSLCLFFALSLCLCVHFVSLSFHAIWIIAIHTKIVRFIYILLLVFRITKQK